jgi:anaerobic magnesium-protoporphyrin IX monomethyl ester cyclase
MTRSALVFPPQWTSSHPNTGLAVVAAELKQAGHEVVFHDLNLDYYDWATQPRALTAAWERAKMLREASLLEAKLELVARGTTDHADLLAARAMALERFLEQNAGSFAKKCERLALATEALRRRETFYDPVAYTTAYARLDEALELHSVAYFPTQMTWNNLSTPAVTSEVADMLAFADDPANNPFHTFMRRQAGRVLEPEPALILIDVLAGTQLLPALTLARALREACAYEATHNPDYRAPYIALCGNHLTRIEDTLAHTPRFFTDAADAVLVSREVGVASALARAVASGEPAALAVSRVPSALYVGQDGTVVKNDLPARRHIDETPFPDFSAFPLERYHAPETVVCGLGSRGCYWGKCRFCDTYFGQPTDTMSLDCLIEGLRRLRRDSGIRHVEFIDTCIHPERMNQLTRAIIDAELDIRWFCNARTERAFTATLFQQMRAAGCTEVMWGIESGSRRLLKLMNKGVNAEARLGILRDAAAAGIWNFAYVFFGFPTETRADAEATIDFICDNTDVVHAYGRSVFTVGKHSPIAQELDRFGLVRLTPDGEDFSKDIGVKVAVGLEGEELRSVGARCAARAIEAYGGDPLWMHLRSRESLHLYLAKHGSAFVRNYHFPLASVGALDDSRYVF